MTAATLPDLDPAVLDEIVPPCEATEIRSAAAGFKPVACEQPAAWAVRGLCGACGHLELDLLCERHHDLSVSNPPAAGILRYAFYCSACTTRISAPHITAERLHP
jgi:hypothetical protein